MKNYIYFKIQLSKNQEQQDKLYCIKNIGARGAITCTTSFKITKKNVLPLHRNTIKI